MLDTEQETALARNLVRFADVVREVEADLLPHKLCEYIFELSGKSDAKGGPQRVRCVCSDNAGRT